VLNPPNRLTPTKKPDTVLGPEQQYAVVLLNEDQLQHLMQRPGMRQVNRGASVRDVHSRYLRLRTQATALAAVLFVVAAGGVMWFLVPRPAVASIFAWKETPDAPTLPTGASFSITVASLDSGDSAGFAATRARSLGLPAFTRLSPDTHQMHQAMVGPYASLDEAERIQYKLVRAGMGGARIFVDESLRNVPRNELPTATIPDGNPAVLLIGAPDRLSLVFEMPSDARQVRSRRTEGLMDLEVGPMLNPVYAQQWVAPEGVHLVERVAIESAPPSENGQFLRAHLAVPEFARAAVRSEGKRVYVDLTWPSDKPDTSAPRAVTRAASVARPVEPPSPSKPAAASADTKSQQQYAEALRPIVDRITEIKPFLVSAAQSGSPEVLKALDNSLAALDASLKGLHPPASAADQHLMLTTVLRVARRAVDPAFTGDREAQVQQALGMFESSTVAVTHSGQ
jgi:hypothetical protein